MANVTITDKDRLKNIRAVLESPSQLAELRKALPPGLPPERVVRQVMTLVQKTPKLLECTPISIVSGLMQSAELGLEMSGPLGQAYLVPYWNNKKKCSEAQMQVGYRGYAQLAHRSDKVLSFFPRRVHANDEFEVLYGTANYIRHKPNLNDPGEVIGYYAACQFKNTGSDFHYMSRAQVQAHRERYCKKNDYTWDTNFDEMAEKTCMRMLAKRLPMTTDLTRAAITEEYAEAGVDMSEAPDIALLLEEAEDGHLVRVAGGDPEPPPE